MTSVHELGSFSFKIQSCDEQQTCFITIHRYLSFLSVCIQIASGQTSNSWSHFLHNRQYKHSYQQTSIVQPDFKHTSVWPISTWMLGTGDCFEQVYCYIKNKNSKLILTEGCWLQYSCLIEKTTKYRFDCT